MGRGSVSAGAGAAEPLRDGIPGPSVEREVRYCEAEKLEGLEHTSDFTGETCGELGSSSLIIINDDEL